MASAQRKLTFLIFVQRKTKTITNNTSRRIFQSAAYTRAAQHASNTCSNTNHDSHITIAVCWAQSACTHSHTQSLTNEIFSITLSPPRLPTYSSGTNRVPQLPGTPVQRDGPGWPKDQTGSRSRRNATARGHVDPRWNAFLQPGSEGEFFRVFPPILLRKRLVVSSIEDRSPPEQTHTHTSTNKTALYGGW